MLNSYYWNNLYIFAVVMKIKILIICLIVSLTARAYNDHRNAKVDSLEALLKSKNPPKGDDLLRAYDNLMRGWLPYDAQKASDYGHKALALSYERNGLNVRQNILRFFAQMHYAHEEHDEGKVKLKNLSLLFFMSAPFNGLNFSLFDYIYIDPPYFFIALFYC